MRTGSLAQSLFRYAVRSYEWARGWRHSPWSSLPPQGLLTKIANRASGLRGAHFRAVYYFAAAVFKFHERRLRARVNFTARVAPPIDAHTLRNVAMWERAVLASPPATARPHFNILVRDAEHVALDRLVSVLLLSESVGSISLFFDEAAVHAARASAWTMAEEGRNGPRTVLDLNARTGVSVLDFDDPEWTAIFSKHGGFDGNVNGYLKVALPGSLVVALGLPESADGFCDESLGDWLAALDAFEAPIPNVSFVVLNAVGPVALAAARTRGGSLPSFARVGGLSFAESLRLAQRSDAYVGELSIYGLAALAARRPGVYLGELAGFASSAARVHAVGLAPAEALERLRPLLTGVDQGPRRTVAGTSHGAAPGAVPLGAGVAAPASRDGGYSLLVPTFNRPQLLARLLRCLDRQGAEFPITVLDSSPPAALDENRATIARSRLDVHHAIYDERTEPYAKIRDGLGRVATEYCSICADDDVLVVEAVRGCVRQLERRPDFALGHGYYFNFLETDTLELSRVMYRGDSIDDDRPLARLRQLFGTYEALFYGVFRTPIAQRAFRDVDRIDSVLGKELLTAALTVISGKALRLPCFYYGRNTAESLPYSAWHPHQMMAFDPQSLFAQFPGFRALLIDALGDAEPGASDPNVARSIDLIFLRYLEQFLRPEALDFMLELNLRGRPSEEIYARFWERFMRPARFPRPSKPLLDVKGRFTPTRLGSDRPRDYEVTGRTPDGRRREYRVHFEFLFPEMQAKPLFDREAMTALLRTLDDY